QEILLVEAGPRVFLLGSSKDGLTALGEFANPDEVAALRAEAPMRATDSSRATFRDALKEGLQKTEAPDASAQAVYASIAEELAELRRTVHAWKA
ncbi:MAG TPA: flagellar biosynthetic protein FliO, partial [Planctomycetota bacterium]|nr:flagellar biosynthetic protein FliO [Planctomycetota bacterium]